MIIARPRYSADDQVNEFVFTSMWAGLSPYHPWAASYPAASYMSADDIQQVAAQTFGWRACDLVLRVH